MGRWKLIWDAGMLKADNEATPQQVWDLLTDVPRVGEWSHECREATWLDGHREATVGAQFTGSNKAGISRWRRLCTVTESEPWQGCSSTGPAAGSRRTPRSGASSRQALPAGGTRIRQSFRILKLAPADGGDDLPARAAAS